MTPQDKFLNLVLPSETLFIQFAFYKLYVKQPFAMEYTVQNSQNKESSCSEKP